MTQFVLPADTPVVHMPIEPEILEGSVCREIFVRAYAEPIGAERKRRRLTRPLPSLEGTVAVLDDETIDHKLVFGVAEIFEGMRLKTRAVFYRDDLHSSDPDAFERLKAICRALGVKLVSREWLFQYVIWPARSLGWIVAGHNIAYDLAHIADEFEPATRSGRYGSQFCNGFAFKKTFVTLEGRQSVVFARIKRNDRHHVRFDMKRAAVVDTASFAFAHSDRNYTLTRACQALGVPLDGERPGAHSGEITLENVAGCLWDVRRTSKLLWALDREHSKHPINLHPSLAHSGATLSKAYVDVLGTRPRLDVQPDFPKSYLDAAAQAYFGGWVDARIT